MTLAKVPSPSAGRSAPVPLAAFRGSASSSEPRKGKCFLMKPGRWLNQNLASRSASAGAALNQLFRLTGAKRLAPQLEEPCLGEALRRQEEALEKEALRAGKDDLPAPARPDIGINGVLPFDRQRGALRSPALYFLPGAPGAPIGRKRFGLESSISQQRRTGSASLGRSA